MGGEILENFTLAGLQMGAPQQGTMGGEILENFALAWLSSGFTQQGTMGKFLKVLRWHDFQVDSPQTGAMGETIYSIYKWEKQKHDCDLMFADGFTQFVVFFEFKW